MSVSAAVELENSRVRILQLPKGNLQQLRMLSRMDSIEKTIGTLAMDLRSSVSEFVDSDLRRKNLTKVSDDKHTSGVANMKDKLSKASKALDKLMGRKLHPRINLHVQGIRESVDNFRVYLLRNEFRPEKPHAASRDLLYTSLAFKSELSDILQNLLSDQESISQPLVENF